MTGPAGTCGRSDCPSGTCRRDAEKNHGDVAFQRRGTGGNRIVPSNATIAGILASIRQQLWELKRCGEETGGSLDLGAFTVDTCRTNSGQISVTVAADLYSHDPVMQEQQKIIQALNLHQWSHFKGACWCGWEPYSHLDTHGSIEDQFFKHQAEAIMKEKEELRTATGVAESSTP